MNVSVGPLANATIRDVSSVIEVETEPPPAWSPRLHPMRYEPDPGRRPGLQCPPDVVRLSGRPAPLGPTSDATLTAVLTETLRVALEVLDGRRPHAQLHSRFTRRTLQCWRVAAEMRPPAAPPSRLAGRIVVCRPRAHVAEVAAVFTVGPRFRALPARFERTSARVWRCTEIRIL